jgi:hypothetical protein
MYEQCEGAGFQPVVEGGRAEEEVRLGGRDIADGYLLESIRKFVTALIDNP